MGSADKRFPGIALISIYGLALGLITLVSFLLGQSRGQIPFAGVIYIGLSAALFFLKNWARMGILAMSWIFLALFLFVAAGSALALIPGYYMYLPVALLPLIVHNVISVIYLTRPAVKKHFRQ